MQTVGKTAVGTSREKTAAQTPYKAGGGERGLLLLYLGGSTESGKRDVCGRGTHGHASYDSSLNTTKKGR